MPPELIFLLHHYETNALNILNNVDDFYGWKLLSKLYGLVIHIAVVILWEAGRDVTKLANHFPAN